eukprot:scaffold7028_cov243-Pinguiococcus_pyrenoidosus.AAC.2
MEAGAALCAAAVSSPAPWAQTAKGVGLITAAVVVELEIFGTLSRSRAIPTVFFWFFFEFLWMLLLDFTLQRLSGAVAQVDPHLRGPRHVPAAGPHAAGLLAGEAGGVLGALRLHGGLRVDC